METNLEDKLPAVDEKLESMDETIKQIFDHKAQDLMKEVVEAIMREKHNSLMIVDEEFNKFSEKITKNFEAVMVNMAELSHKLGTIDLECASLMSTMIDKKMITPEELGEKYKELVKEIQEEQKKLMEEEKAKNAKEDSGKVPLKQT